jgi:hypothetical protein
LEPAAREQVGRRGGLGHVERVLVAHVDDAGADLDAARLDADRREERERGGELAREVVDADERSVDPNLLGCDRELHRLAERIAACVRQPAAWMPSAEREEAQFLGIRHLDHQNVVEGSSISIAVVDRTKDERLATTF